MLMHHAFAFCTAIAHVVCALDIAYYTPHHVHALLSQFYPRNWLEQGTSLRKLTAAVMELVSASCGPRCCPARETNNKIDKKKWR